MRICVRGSGGCGRRRPSRDIYPLRASLALVGSVADTKLNGALKGAALLTLVSLSADASQGP